MSANRRRMDDLDSESRELTGERLMVGLRAGNVHQRIEETGIGLALVKEIVEQNGGEVSVISDEGHGSTFTVRLPTIDGPITPC